MCKCYECHQDEILNKIMDYMGQTKFIVLGYVSKDGKPVLRTLASFANDRFEVYFSTGKHTAKISHIKANPSVTILFQHEGQELITFKNVTYAGKAGLVNCDNGLEKAMKLLSEKNPWFKSMAQRGELREISIFKVEPESIQYLDYSNGIGPASVKEIKF